MLTAVAGPKGAVGSGAGLVDGAGVVVVAGEGLVVGDGLLVRPRELQPVRPVTAMAAAAPRSRSRRDRFRSVI